MKALARLRPHAIALLGALAGVAVMAWMGLLDFGWSDYDTEAAPAFKALLEGDLGGFFRAAPTYGGSLVLRAPFASLPTLWGGGELAAFRAGSIACLLAAAAFGVWMVARMRAEHQPRLARATALGLCVASPITLRALEIGHPEELLGAVLAVAAVLAAGGRRATWAGLLLGLAIATKAWAVLAVGPVLLALPAHRWRALLLAGVVAAVITAPLVIADHQTFATKGASMAQTGHIFQPGQLWWFLGDADAVVLDGQGRPKPGARGAPAWLTGFTHPLIVLIGVALSLLLFRVRRGRVTPADALLLLVLLLHLRCVLDVWNNVYYALPSLFALLAWETRALRRPPVLTLAATVLVWVTQEVMRLHATPDAMALAYLAWAVPSAFALGHVLLNSRPLALRRSSPITA